MTEDVFLIVFLFLWLDEEYLFSLYLSVGSVYLCVSTSVSSVVRLHLRCTFSFSKVNILSLSQKIASRVETTLESGDLELLCNPSLSPLHALSTSVFINFVISLFWPFLHPWGHSFAFICIFISIVFFCILSYFHSFCMDPSLLQSSFLSVCLSLSLQWQGHEYLIFSLSHFSDGLTE